MKNLIIIVILALTATAASAQASLKAGIKHLLNENYTAAADQFNAIAKADPRNASIYYWIGEVSYVQDNAAEAEKAYRKGLSINSQCAECKVGLGKVALDQGKVAEANELFESAAKLDKKNPEIFARIGDAYLYGKKPNADKAVEYLGQARDMNPANPVYWAHLGDAYLLLGNNGEAVTHYEEAIRKDPSITSAYVSLARIWMAAKAYDSAISNLQKAIQRSPDDANPYKYLVEVYIIEKKYDLVTPLLQKYITLIGDDVDARVRYVKFLTFQAKDYDRAIEEGEKLLKEHPDQYTLHRWLAWSYGEKGMYPESYQHSQTLFDELAKDDTRKAFPSDYDYWAKAAFGIDSLDEAAHIYRKLIELDSTLAEEVYGKLAKAYYDKRNWAQAVAYYERRDSIKPLNVTDDYYLAISYYLNKQDVLADSAFSRVLAITPNNATSWWYKARIADAKDALADSTKLNFSSKPYYEKYIEFAKVDPDPAKNKNLRTAYLLIASYYVQKGQNADALDLYEKYLAIDPEDKEVQDNIRIIKESR